jgi:hypothetical protein
VKKNSSPYTESGVSPMYLNHHHFGNYPLVNKHNYGKIPFSIAMLKYQRVYQIYTTAAKTLAYCSTTPKAIVYKTLTSVQI